MSENNYPHLCREVGLSCEECVGSTARHVARLCTGLRGSAVRQLFVQLYPHPACLSMHSLFSAAYREKSRADSECGAEQMAAAAAVA